MQNRKLLTTDGPFAETKKQLGGYYILECKDWMKQLRGQPDSRDVGFSGRLGIDGRGPGTKMKRAIDAYR